MTSTSDLSTKTPQIPHSSESPNTPESNPTNSLPLGKKNKELLYSLFNLYKRLGSHGGVIEGSLLERYVHFCENSESGEQCPYAQKSKELFLRHDYSVVRDKFLETLRLFRSVEGDSFGR